jgi:hypothetical protein
MLLLGPFAAGAQAGPVNDGLAPVLGPVKQTANLLLPTTCSVVYQQAPALYATCHQTLNSLSLNGNNLRYWLFESCYQYEDGTYSGPLDLGICPSDL